MHKMHQRMLKQAAGRLMRPQLTAAVAMWRDDFLAEQKAQMEREKELLKAAQERQQAALEAQLMQLRDEMAITQSDGTARAEALQPLPPQRNERADGRSPP